MNLRLTRGVCRNIRIAQQTGDSFMMINNKQLENLPAHKKMKKHEEL